MKLLLPLLAFAASGAAMAADDAAVLRCRAITDIQARVACYDAMPLSGAALAIAAPAKTPEQNFGLSGHQLRQQSGEPDTVETSIAGHFEGWGPSSRFTLANGQVWRVADDSQGSVAEKDNPKVKLVRNSFGTIFMEIEGSNQAPRVRRER